MEDSKLISAAVWDARFHLWIQTEKQSALHLSMLRCGNDFTIPHTVVGNMEGSSDDVLLIYFLSFLVPVLSLGLRTPDFSLLLKQRKEHSAVAGGHSGD